MAPCTHSTRSSRSASCPAAASPQSSAERRLALENTAMCRHTNPIPQCTLPACPCDTPDLSALLEALARQTALLQDILCAISGLTAACLSRPEEK